MLFVELRFFIFFAVVLGVYWSLQQNHHRKFFLLAASYYFYGSWDWRFVCMLFGLSVADYFLSRAIFASGSPGWRKVLVSLSIAMNLSVLCFFKYFNFFTASTVALAHHLGIHLSDFTLRVILPVGISFFTFQSLSYTIDVYRREIAPARSLLDYLMFAGFFPQLVAGPIVRPKYFLPQLDSPRSFSSVELKPLLLLFLLGFFKKTCLADNISPYVDQVFKDPAGFTCLSSITAVWLYATQIYCDFSGYSDMAIAVAGLMGFQLVLNFDAPYLATSIQDFWRRWHISLSSWIRDYIYVSLGGRSAKIYLTYRNLLLTMLAGGLWHGAAWTFVIWGGLHGMALVVNHECRRIFGDGRSPLPIPAFLGWLVTINFVCLAWITFRAPDFATCLTILKHYLLIAPGGHRMIPVWLVGFAPGLLVVQLLMRKWALVKSLAQAPWTSFALSYGCLWAITLALLPLGYRPFIYFQF